MSLCTYDALVTYGIMQRKLTHAESPDMRHKLKEFIRREVKPQTRTKCSSQVLSLHQPFKKSSTQSTALLFELDSIVGMYLAEV